jgi:neutral ceramidase
MGMRAGGFQSNPSRHAHDELYARCLVLDYGTTQIAFIICDLTIIDREIFDEAKRLIRDATGLPMENVVGAATHTHSAANIRASHPHRMDFPLRDYEKFLAQRMADGVRRAVNQLEPARIA